MATPQLITGVESGRSLPAAGPTVRDRLSTGTAGPRSRRNHRSASAFAALTGSGARGAFRQQVIRRDPSLRRPRVLAEIGLLVLVYVGYSLTRTIVDSPPAVARANGEWVLAAEQRIGLDIEAGAISWLMQSTFWSVTASYAYAALHYTVTPLVLCWLYRSHPRQYRRQRTALVLATCLALLFYWLMPTAPPRLLADAFPDVLALTADYGWWGAEASAPRGLGSLTNQYAAMPSMHVGWAAWCSLAVLCVTRRKVLRALAVAYPLLLTGIVVATGNHYVLDAVAGAVLVGGVMLLLRHADVRLRVPRVDRLLRRGAGPRSRRVPPRSLEGPPGSVASST